ncbi:MAG: SGNH/GDSL hydrolase family protein [Alicyclobacillus sp.]|nr:SGNH/GDSL hydrolase family protein [Alicyclobacillus sp.]
MDRRPKGTRTRWRAMVRYARRTLPLVALPVLTVTSAVILVWRLPHAQVPAAFQVSATDAATRPRSTVISNGTDALGTSSSSQAPTGGGHPAHGAPSPGHSNGAGRNDFGGATGDASQANSPHAPGQRAAETRYVALGDSITFGYGLPGSTATAPSHDAYPFLVGQQEGWAVTDLGVPGWTSQNLLQALATPKFQHALQHADVVTIDIGSNDLLHASYNLLSPQAALPPKDAVTDSALLQAALSGYATRLPEILAKVQSLTKAPIVLIDLYDPFPDASSLHNVGEQLIGAANEILWQTAAKEGIPVVDAHAAFNHHQQTDVRLDSLDIHPTVTGQQVLARLVEAAIANPLAHQPAIFAVSPAGTLVYSQTAPGPFAIGWLHGDMAATVTGQSGDHLKVLLPNGQTGYVSDTAVKLLIRPFPDVVFSPIQTAVGIGTLEGGDEAKGGTAGAAAAGTSGLGVASRTSGASGGTTGWIRCFSDHGTVYAPLSWFAQVTGGTVQEETDQRVLTLSTPLHSGLVQNGWDEQGSAPPQSWHYAPTPSQQSVELETNGWVLEVDGEPVDLTHPVVEWDGTWYAPAAELWEYLGGDVTRGTGGLLTLSAGGS